MTRATQSILKQALTLNPVDRAELIDALFHSFDQRNSTSNDALWTSESEARLDAYNAGKIAADTVEAVFDRIDK